MQYYFDAKINIDMLNLKPLHLKAVNKSQIVVNFKAMSTGYLKTRFRSLDYHIAYQ